MRNPNLSRRGANAIEFALTVPFFLILVLGLVDYGFLFMLQAGLDNSTAMACREGAMTDPSLGSPSAVASAELDSRSAMFCTGECTTTVTDLNSGAYLPPNRTLRCEVTRDVTPLSGFVPYPSVIGSVSYYRLEWQR